MITWNGRNANGNYIGNCLAKDVPNLPTSGEEYKNGSGMYVMDTGDYYKFDEENKIWILQ